MPFVLVGATGFEPVTSSVSANHREPHGRLEDGRWAAGAADPVGRERVRRLDPAARQRAWEHDPEIIGLVRSMVETGGYGLDVPVNAAGILVLGPGGGRIRPADPGCSALRGLRRRASRPPVAELR
jgi:hypothetical protein